jgi:hypothetical protein
VGIRVDEGDTVALLVCTGKVDGVAMVASRATVVIYLIASLPWIEEFGALSEVFLGDKTCRRDFGDTGVCNPQACIGKRNPKRLNNSVKILHSVVLAFCECRDLPGLFPLLQYSVGHEGYDSLAVWWMLPHLNAMVFVAALVRQSTHILFLCVGVALPPENVRDWSYWHTVQSHMARQIFKLKQSTTVFSYFDNLFYNSAGINGFLSIRGKCSESVCQDLILENLSRLCPTIRAIWVLYEQFPKF